MKLRHADLLGVFGVLFSFLVASCTLFISPILSIPFYLTTFFCIYFLELVHNSEEDVILC